MTFASVLLDVDSTLCAITGIDWLARRRGRAVASLVAALTEQAMSGNLPLEKVYADRLAFIRPRLRDIELLAAEYRRTLALGAKETISQLRFAGVRVVLISSGVRQAIEPLARHLNFAPSDLHAVPLRWSDDGDYLGFDCASPLTMRAGKLATLRALALPRPILAVVDGATGLELRRAVDRTITSFRELLSVAGGR